MLAAQRYYIVVLAIFLVIVTCSFYLFRSDDLGAYEKVAKVPYRSAKPSVQNTIATLFESIKHDPSAPGYIDAAGQYYKGGNETVWKKPLGKKVLIVDIDTRVPTGENQIFNPDTLDFDHLPMHGGGLVSNAIINHYLYATIHGYDYRFYQAQHMVNHSDTWIMPHVFRELIPEYDFVVAMDADVVVAHLDVPLEWMFNRWGIKEHTSMALPWDTEEVRGNMSLSVDSKKLRVLNTGFVVAQNSELTLELLEAWRDCTSETRYPGCAKWAETWSHEQRAFSEYIRYDFNRTPETVVSIPCDDAVGWPGFKKEIDDPKKPNESISDCNGNFVRHYTLKKDKVKTAGATSVMQLMAEVLQKSLLSHRSAVWYKEPAKQEQEVLNEDGSSENTEIRKDDSDTEHEKLSTEVKDTMIDLPE